MCRARWPGAYCNTITKHFFEYLPSVDSCRRFLLASESTVLRQTTNMPSSTMRPSSARFKEMLLALPLPHILYLKEYRDGMM